MITAEEEKKEDDTVPPTVELFPMKKGSEVDPETGMTYDIIGMTNYSSTKIFAEVRLQVESPVKIKSIEIKRLKHPAFYSMKTTEQLGKIAFPILLKEEKVDDENSYKQCFRSGILDYVNPNTSRYYLLKITPHINHSPSHLMYCFRGKMI